MREHKSDRQDTRASNFNEQVAAWQLPMNEMNIPTDVVVSKGKSLSMVVLENIFSVYMLQICFFFTI